MRGSVVTVQYYKYSGLLHWRHEMVGLGRDAHGIWLGAPRGALIQKGDEPAIPWETPFVQLVPRNEWWCLLYNAGPAPLRVYTDIITPARWASPNRVEMVDRDLDIVRFDDGRVQIIDQDEFERHREELGYPQKVAERALATAHEALEAVQASTDPFGDAGAHWLGRLVSKSR